MTTTTFPAGKLLSAQRIELTIQALAGAANVNRHLSEVGCRFALWHRLITNISFPGNWSRVILGR